LALNSALRLPGEPFDPVTSSQEFPPLPRILLAIQGRGSSDTVKASDWRLGYQPRGWLARECHADDGSRQRLRLSKLLKTNMRSEIPAYMARPLLFNRLQAVSHDFAHRRGARASVMPPTGTRHDYLTIASNYLTIGLNYLTISCGKTTG
jgi:hypothetical protein